MGNDINFCESCKNERQHVIQEIKARKTGVDESSRESTHELMPLHSAVSKHHKTKRERGVVEMDEIKHT